MDRWMERILIVLVIGFMAGLIGLNTIWKTRQETSQAPLPSPDAPPPPRAISRETLREYPEISLKKIASGEWVRPRATVVGTVTEVRTEADHDIHIRLNGEGTYIICEIIPELPLPRPREKQRIRIWGVVRFDGKHDWYELHPVIGWETVP